MWNLQEQRTCKRCSELHFVLCAVVFLSTVIPAESRATAAPRQCAKISMLREGELRCHASSATRLPFLPQSHSSPPSQAVCASARKFKNTTGPTKAPICALDHDPRLEPHVVQ